MGIPSLAEEARGIEARADDEPPLYPAEETLRRLAREVLQRAVPAEAQRAMLEATHTDAEMDDWTPAVRREAVLAESVQLLERVLTNEETHPFAWARLLAPEMWPPAELSSQGEAFPRLLSALPKNEPSEVRLREVAEIVRTQHREESLREREETAASLPPEKRKAETSPSKLAEPEERRPGTKQSKREEEEEEVNERSPPLLQPSSGVCVVEEPSPLLFAPTSELIEPLQHALAAQRLEELMEQLFT